MTTPRILLFAESSGGLQLITHLISGHCELCTYSLRHRLTREEASPLPSLVLFLHKNSAQQALSDFQALKNLLPDTPVIFLGENPSKEDIIEAFRLGAKDYLIFPIQPEVLLQLVQPYLNQSKGGLLFFFKTLLFRIFKFLFFKKIHTNKKNQPTPSEQPEISVSWQHGADIKTNPDLRVHFFGKLTVQTEGKNLNLLPGEKMNALLAYLLFAHAKPVHREVLLSKFWGYTGPNAARNSLNVAMHNLRRHLQQVQPGVDFLHYSDDCYSVNPAFDIRKDTEQFLLYWQKGRAMELKYGLPQAYPAYQKAASLYQGDFLNNIHYEEWCEAERHRFKETYLLILDRLGTYYLQEKAYTSAIHLFEKILEKDSCLEDAHQKLILSYYKLGLRDKAIKQYLKCEETLRKELKMELSPSTTELLKMIRGSNGLFTTFF